jgi:hypothetical protein
MEKKRKRNEEDYEKRKKKTERKKIPHPFLVLKTENKIEELYKTFPKSKKIFKNKNKFILEFRQEKDVVEALKNNEMNLKRAKEPKKEKIKKDKIFISGIDANRVKKEDLQKYLEKTTGEIISIELEEKYENRGYCFLKLKQIPVEGKFKNLKIEKLKNEIFKNEIKFKIHDSIYVSGYNKQIRVNDILEMFKEEVVLGHFFPCESKVVCVVHFKKEKSSYLAITKLNKTKLNGCILNISLFDQHKK